MLNIESYTQTIDFLTLITIVPDNPLGGNINRPIFPCFPKISSNSFACVPAGKFLTRITFFDFFSGF